MTPPRTIAPARGDIWRVAFDPTAGHEQAGTRPALVISATTYNRGPQQLAVVLPMTTTRRQYVFHVWLQAADSGLRRDSAVMCDQIRTVSLARFQGDAPIGHVSGAVMASVEQKLRALLQLPANP